MLQTVGDIGYRARRSLLAPHARGMQLDRVGQRDPRNLADPVVGGVALEPMNVSARRVEADVGVSADFPSRSTTGTLIDERLGRLANANTKAARLRIPCHREGSA